MLDGNSIAQIYRRVNMGETFALGNAGQQCFNGTQKLVGIDPQRGKRHAVGYDILRFFRLFPGKICFTGYNILCQHLLQLRDFAGVVQATHGDCAEIGSGQLLNKLL